MRRTRKWLAAMRGRRIGKMPLTKAERQARWARAARARLLDAFGNFCWVGGENGGTALEFAHRYPTGLEGRSRGSTARLRDIREHPFAYFLVCKRHHRVVGGPETWGPFPVVPRPVPRPPGPTVPDDDEEDPPEPGPYQASVHEDD